MTGTTLHTVSRILSAWEQQGLVEGGRQRIVLRNPHALFGLAEGQSRPVPPVPKSEPALSRSSRLRGLAQPIQKLAEIDPVLATGLVDRVERRDRAADTVHAEIDEDADGRRPSSHDGVDGHLGGRKRDLFHGPSLRDRRHRSLC